MSRTVFQVFKRFLHDRKLPEVTIPKVTHTSLIGTQSPKKTNYNLAKTRCKPLGRFNNINEVVKARKNYNKAIREIYIKNSI